jgi:hypothetical protein
MNAEDKKVLTAKITKLRDISNKMLALLEKDEYERLCDLHVELDDSADALYDDIVHLLVDVAYGTVSE